MSVVFNLTSSDIVLLFIVALLNAIAFLDQPLRCALSKFFPQTIRTEHVTVAQAEDLHRKRQEDEEP